MLIAMNCPVEFTYYFDFNDLGRTKPELSDERSNSFRCWFNCWSLHRIQRRNEGELYPAGQLG
jgi:hypothetical protein